MQIKKHRSGILIIIYVIFGVYFFVLGDNGILERMRLQQAKNEIKNSIAELTRENKNLQKEYFAVSNKQTNNNFYKEEAAKAGYISKGEKYIFFKGSEKKQIINSDMAGPESSYPVKIEHLRILWIISSIIIISLFLWKKSREKKNFEDNIKA